MASMTRAQIMIEHDASAYNQPWFNHQAAAMARSDALGGMFIWSRDNRKLWVAGQEPPKEFTSCSLAVIWRYMYSRNNAFHRNVYEIIREKNPDGSTVPSKIHMDCDISCKDLDAFSEKGRAFHEVFERDLREFLVAEVNPMFGDTQLTPLFCMDSSNATKFSMHYVMGGAMFYNNFHVGALMRRFREYVAHKHGEPNEGRDNPYFFASKAKHDIVDGRVQRFVIDMIYTRNRAFRLLGNCKYSKDTLLIPHGMDRAKQQEYRFTVRDLLTALVQDPVLAERCPIFSVQELNGADPRSQGSSRIGIARGETASAMRLSVSRVNLATELRHEARGSGRVEEVAVPRELAVTICDELEQVHSHVKLSSANVKYRPYEMDFVVAFMRSCTYCYIAERNHSSSPCYFIVSYSRGAYWQRCHKAGCRSPSLAVQDRVTWDMLPRLRAAIDKFLAAPACGAAPRVPTEKMATLLDDVAAMIPDDYVETDAPTSDAVDGMEIDMFIEHENSQGY